MSSFYDSDHHKDTVKELIVKTPEELAAYIEKKSKVSADCRKFEVLCEIFEELKLTDDKEFFGRLLKYIEDTNAPVCHPVNCNEDCDSDYKYYALYNVLPYGCPFLLDTMMLCKKRGAMFNEYSEQEEDFWLIQDLFDNGTKHDDNESIWILDEYVKATDLDALKQAMNHSNIEEMCITKNVFDHLEYIGVVFSHRFLNDAKWVKDGTILTWKVNNKHPRIIKTVSAHKEKKAKKDNDDDQ